MGYGMMAWAVDLDQIRAEVGCGDSRLAARYAASFSEEMEQQGNSVSHFAPSLDDGDVFTFGDVAHQVIMGGPLDGRFGSAYGYFVEHLCGIHGTFLPNDEWVSVPADYCAQLDRVLGAAGVPNDVFSVVKLAWSGPPVPLPRYEDLPGIGYVDYHNIDEHVIRRLSSITSDDIPDPEEHLPPIRQIAQWLVQARDKHRSVVAFFH